MTGPLAEKTEEKKLTRSDLKRSAIVKAASEVFAEHGYEATSMDQIAALANVSKRTVYNHFENKASLYEAIITGECGLALEVARGRLEEDAPIAEGLTRYGIDFLTFIFQPRSIQIFRGVVAEACRFPELGEIFFKTGVCPAQVGVNAFIAKAMERGELRQDDPEFAGTMFFSMLQSDLHFRLLLGLQEEATDEEIEILVTRVVGLWMRAYAPE